MATYTDNYTMTKPTYAEQADISVINANMDIIDNVMHSSQISLAPAYDLNETYNTGDIVMHELLMYKCLADNVTGAWDSTKWERTTASETGGGADFDLYGEASGTAEASFSDGAEASLVECEIGIEPQQDLHGYSKPWAGGAGANMLHNTLWTETPYGIEVVTPPSSYRNTILYNSTLSIGNYTIKDFVDGSNSTHQLALYKNGTAFQYLTEGSYTFNVDNASDTYEIRLYVYSGNTDALCKPMMVSGSSINAYEPYANICPISGHTDVTVTVASTSGGSGEDTTVSLGRTVYGGTLDVTRGILTDNDGALISFTSANTNVWSGVATSPQGVTRFYTTPSYVGRTLIRSDSYKLSPNYNTETDIITTSLDGRIIITPTFGQGKTLEEFKALLATYPFNAEMTLATPQTFNLTPTQVVKTLLGQNYVSHDGGGTISLVYIKKDSTIIPNPSDAEVPLTGLEISGKGFKITDARIPAPPTTNGAYVLTVTVSGGTPTYSWENA